MPKSNDSIEELLALSQAMVNDGTLSKEEDEGEVCHMPCINCGVWVPVDQVDDEGICILCR